MTLTSPGVFNIAKGSWAYLTQLPLGTDALEIMLLKTTVVVDATMKDYATVAAILAANTECTFTNYARLVVNSGITVATSNTTDNTTTTMSTWSWLSAGGASNDAIVALIVSYRKTSSATDAQKIPLWYYPEATTTSGSNLATTFTGSGGALAAAG